MKKFIYILALAVVAVLTFCSCRPGKDVSREFVEGIDGGRYYYKDGLDRWYGMNALTESSSYVYFLLHKADSLGRSDETSVWCEYIATVRYDIVYGDDYMGKVSIKVDIRPTKDSSYYIPVVFEHYLSYESMFDPFMTRDMLCYAQERGGEWKIEGTSWLSNGYLQKIRNS